MKRTNECKDFTADQLKREIDRVDHHRRHRAILKRTISGLIIVAALAVLATAIWFPIYPVTDDAMAPILQEGDIVIGFRTNRLQRGDIGAFYHEDQILIRRIETHGSGFVDAERSIPEEYYALNGGSGTEDILILPMDKIAAKVILRIRPFW